MSDSNVRILGDVDLSGLLVFDRNFTEFPTTPQSGTLVVKDGTTYIYTELTSIPGYFTWQPIGQKQTAYLFTQTTSSATWTVNHNLNTTNFTYFVYNSQHQLVETTIQNTSIDTAVLTLPSAMTGTAVFFSIQYLGAPVVEADSVIITTLELKDSSGTLTVNDQPIATTTYVANAISDAIFNPLAGEEMDTLASVTARGSTTSDALTLTNTTSSTSTTTGALVVSGGVGVEEQLTANTVATTKLTVDGIAAIDTSTLVTTTTQSDQVLDIISASSVRSVKYLVQATNGIEYQVVELLVIHNGASVSFVEYANVSTGGDLANFDADISGTNLRLLTTPTNENTTFKTVRTSITQ